MQKVKPSIRPLESQDIPQIAEAFEKIGWNKPASQYERYLMEQVAKLRVVYVAFVEEQFAGYLTICWISSYPAFREAMIPEVVDFNVLPKFQRQGIGTQLMDLAENEIAKRSPMAGIGVGLYPNYGAAQRMYVLRGYVPDGRGLYQNYHFPKHGEQIIVDDGLALYFTKDVK